MHIWHREDLIQNFKVKSSDFYSSINHRPHSKQRSGALKQLEYKVPPFWRLKVASGKNSQSTSQWSVTAATAAGALHAMRIRFFFFFFFWSSLHPCSLESAAVMQGRGREKPSEALRKGTPVEQLSHLHTNSCLIKKKPSGWSTWGRKRKWWRFSLSFIFSFWRQMKQWGIKHFLPPVGNVCTGGTWLTCGGVDVRRVGNILCTRAIFRFIILHAFWKGTVWRSLLFAQHLSPLHLLSNLA